METLTKKQIQNRQNYERRRNKILLRAKLGRFFSKCTKKFSNLFELMFPKRQRRRVGEWVGRSDSPEKLFLLVLICTIACFSIRESTRFILESEGDPSGALLKALISEGIVIAFSWLTFKKWTLQAIKGFLLVGSCLYSLFTTSGSLFISGAQSVETTSTVHQLIFDTERELSEKQKLRTHYLDTLRLGAARILDSKIDQLQEKLDGLRYESLKYRNPILTKVTLISLVFFRILVLVANILLVHRVAELFQRNSSNFSKFKPGLVLVKG